MFARLLQRTKLNKNLSRLLSDEADAAKKQFLFKVREVRRSTGARITDCQEAVEKFPDVNDAIVFLQNTYKTTDNVLSTNADKQLQHGMVGALVTGTRSCGVISKLYCKTDFVAQNEIFLDTFERVLNAVRFEYTTNYNNEPLDKTVITYDLIKDVHLVDKDNNKTDVTVKNALEELSNKVGENIYLDDCIALVVPRHHYLGWYVHWPSNNTFDRSDYHFSYGRTGAFTVITPTITHRDDKIEKRQRLYKLARAAAVHVVGMVPSSMWDENKTSPGDGIFQQTFFMDPSKSFLSWTRENFFVLDDFVLVE